MEVLQKMDTEEQIQEFFDEIKDFTSKKCKKAFIALGVLSFVPEERLTPQFLLETIKKVLDIEFRNTHEINDNQVIKGFLDKQKIYIQIF